MTLGQLDIEYRNLLSELERVKLTYKMGEMNAHVTESTIGFEENRVLRTELDTLHEEYNRIIDNLNH